MKIVRHFKMREKGQITIPSGIRSSLGLKKGSQLIAFVTEKEIILRPKIANPMSKAGMLGKEEKFTRIKDLISKYKGFG